MTYFKTNYEPQDSPLGESFEIPFDNQQVRFGTTSECTIPAYGDILSKTFLRTTLPPIYPPQTGTYVYPSTSTSFSGALLVQKNLTYVAADGSNLTANTDGSHFFSVGAEVILSGTAYSFFNLDGVYTISSVPTANSFVCSSGIAGISYNGKVSTVGIRPAPVVGYYSTQNLNLWAEIPVNLAYTSVGGQMSDPVASLVPGQTIDVFQSSATMKGKYTVATSSANTFTLVNQSLNYSLFIAFNALAYANQSYMISPDGINWTEYPLPFNNIYWDSSAYGNGTFVAVANAGSPRVMTSPDAVNWTAQSSPTAEWVSVIYRNGLFVAVAPYGPPSIMTSPDGINWTTQTAPSSSPWATITYGNGLFVAGALAGTPIMTSPDGVNWTAQTAPAYSRSLTYGNGLFVSVMGFYGSGSEIMTSPDGVNWTSQTFPSLPSGLYLNSVTYGNGLFVAVFANGSYINPENKILTSPDGVNWSLVTVPSSTWLAADYGNGVFVVV